MRSLSRSHAVLLSLCFIVFPVIGQTGPTVEPPAGTFFMPVEIGERLNGRLDQNEMVGSELVDWYELRISADTTVEILLRSNEIDTYLVAILPDGSVLENDDAVGTDSIVTATSDIAGSALVGVTSYGYSSPGSYSLEIQQVSMPTVSVGTTVFAELGSSGLARYRLRPDGESVLSIEVRSGVFDTYLEVESDNGAFYYNDDAGSTSRSRVIVPFEESGEELTIIVSSYGAETGSGAFELSIEELDVEPLLYPDGYLLSDGEQVRSIAIPAPGIFDTIVSRFLFRATEGERLELELESADFDSYVEVMAPGGTRYEDDDSGGYPNSQLVFVAPETGVYEAFAGSINRTDAGVFSLGFRRLGTAETILNATGELTSRDESDIMGKHYDLYRFTASRGDSVMLELQSDEFDAYLILRSPDGEILLQDDDGGSGLNSRAEYRIELSGEYELVVTSVSNGSLGSYSVQIYK